MHDEIRPLVDGHQTEQPEKIRVELYDPLYPGGSAKAKIVFFDDKKSDGQSEADEQNSPPYLAIDDSEIVIHDPLRLTFGLAGDRLWVSFNRDSDRWETLNVAARLERGVLNEELVMGGSASVSIRRRRNILDEDGNPTGDTEIFDTGFDLDAWDSLLTDDNTLPIGTLVQIAIFPDGFIDVINASCTPIAWP